MAKSRLWELRHTRFDEVMPEHDFWYAINKNTGKTVSAWNLNNRSTPGWCQSACLVLESIVRRLGRITVTLL